MKRNGVLELKPKKWFPAGSAQTCSWLSTILYVFSPNPGVTNLTLPSSMQLNICVIGKNLQDSRSSGNPRTFLKSISKKQGAI
ncbi:hypothetical protein DPEC_G00020670 [Dallia pectoralis]|uniref:Uncharacterized protein n=1 Tax=Dallia pectoralis TaxID=75939 RepID=A0ACC2HG14_DALPE|nr:hypothetical protein DPEC_G00020670 [Dallia pectoralis]